MTLPDHIRWAAERMDKAATNGPIVNAAIVAALEPVADQLTPDALNALVACSKQDGVVAILKAAQSAVASEAQGVFGPVGTPGKLQPKHPVTGKFLPKPDPNRTIADVLAAVTDNRSGDPTQATPGVNPSPMAQSESGLFRFTPGRQRGAA